jgi:hypothetical protein
MGINQRSKQTNSGHWIVRAEGRDHEPSGYRGLERSTVDKDGRVEEFCEGLPGVLAQASELAVGGTVQFPPVHASDAELFAELAQWADS